MNSLNKVVIFGATSGIAEKVALYLVNQGASVYCIARNQEKLQMLLTDLKIRADNTQIIAGYSADLADTEEHRHIWQNAKTALNGCDGVLIAYGILPNQHDCEKNASLALESIHINSISIVNLLTYIANDMQAQNNGVIAVISSVAGDRGRQSNYIYGAAKGMLTIFLQGLRNRLYKKGVSVVTIKPGLTKTAMTEHLERSGILWASPEIVAKGIIRAMRKGKNEVYLPGRWRIIMAIIKSIPETIFKRLSL